uniref:MFS domain-containing protein n=1 Tax=Heterorhabditis bacteriophora TaxID=37862 RepID=A0A1I7XKX2_HETBA
MLVGGLALLLIFYLIPQDSAEQSSHFRNFSESHIQAIYATFFSLSLIAIIIFTLLPDKQFDKQIGKTLINTNMMLLSFTFLYMGFLVSFFLGIYPTTLSFTSTLSKDVYIVAFYSVFAGLAEFSGK